MLSQKKAARAYALFDTTFIHGKGDLGGVRELHVLLAQASDAQRTWITRELDNDAQDVAVATAMGLIAAIIEIADPLRELVVRRYRAWTVVEQAFRGFEPPAAATRSGELAEAPPAAQSEPPKPRCAPRHEPGRSHDGKRPWSTRIRMPRHKD